MIYFSSFFQLLDLTPDQKQWLCNHLGHTFDVHNQYYKLKLDAVELTHVSQTLLVSECGLLSKFKGKKIEDVKITEEEDLRVLEDLEEVDPDGIREGDEEENADKVNHDPVADSSIQTDQNQEQVVQERPKRNFNLRIKP